MGQIIAVVSGKGGTGKTTVTAGVASCLAAEAQKVLCIDLDVGLRNLDISLGCADVASLSFQEVCSGSYSVEDAPEHPQIPGLHLLTAPTAATDRIDVEAMERLLQDAAAAYDWVLLDAPAGIGSGFQTAVSSAAKTVVVVTNADPASLRDAASVGQLLRQQGKKDVRLVVNRVSHKLYARLRTTVDDVMDSAGLPLLGIVPEDDNVPMAAATGTALILASSRGAAVACLHIARRLRGRRVPLMRL